MLSQAVLKKTMQAKTDEELYLVLRIHPQDYTPEAIRAAIEEFNRRQLDEATMSRIAGVAKKALEETDGKQGGPEQKPQSEAEETAAGWGWSVFIKAARGLGWLVLLCFVGYLINGWLDSIGWVTHSHDTPVWIEGDWMVGEYRECEMMTKTPPPGVTLSPEVRAELPRLFCGKRDEHGALSVTAFVHQFLNNPQGLTDAGDALGSGGDWSEFDSKFHVLPVDYHGRIDRPDEPFVSWRCQHLNGSLECKALN